MTNLDTLSKNLIDSFNQIKEERVLTYNNQLVEDFINQAIKVILFDFLNFKKENLKLNLEKLVIYLKQLKIREKDIQTFLNNLVEIRNYLNGSLEAIKQGDPACDSYSEIVLSYLGFEAITYYRIANNLYKLNYKVLARMISELAHEKTGIDINPGASIGKNFFIDHGTGIVIGQTCIIGDNVKLYQGITLGALSLKQGALLKNQKRHPTVLNNVTIYANASIFGGDTIIGNNVTIGANVYLTHSIEDNKVCFISSHGIQIEDEKLAKY